MGRLSAQKGVDILQKITPQLDSDTSLITVLSGKKFTLKKSFCLCDVPYGDMPLLYSACDFFILPSRYEACSVSVIEAMAAELPMITRVGHAREIARE